MKIRVMCVLAAALVFNTGCSNFSMLGNDINPLQSLPFWAFLTDQEAVDADVANLLPASIQGSNSDLDTVTANLSYPLPASGTRGTIIIWNSGTPSVISDSGTVSCPVYPAADSTVILTATITRGTVSKTKDFTITVLAKQTLEVTIDLTNPEDENIGFSGPSILSVSGTNGPQTMTITVTAGLGTYTWLLDGDAAHASLSASSNTATITAIGGFLDLSGGHSVILVVSYPDSSVRSYQCTFSVAE